MLPHELDEMSATLRPGFAEAGEGLGDIDADGDHGFKRRRAASAATR